MPAKIYLYLDKYSGDFRAMPAYIEKLKRCVVKWVNVHPKNTKSGLPAVMAIIILSDPANGLPLCIMDGTYVTNIRTGAAGAVAAKFLAGRDSKIAGMVGCGAQARTQLLALLEIFNIKKVKAWGRDRLGINNFIKDMKLKGIEFVSAPDIKTCVTDSDIVVTTTPSRKPIVKLKWLKRGAHINAVGADAKGKQELEPEILKKAKVVVDSWEQASHSGEINVPLSKRMITEKDIYADIGEVVVGKKRGRASRQELTVFDSTGLAIQDLAVADLIYKTAIKKNIGKWVDIIG